jgi:hypothetical protein
MFTLWLQAQLRKISGKTKLAEAIRYALNRMPKARGYLSDGRLELDNNTCERTMRPVALGRKTICSWAPSVAETRLRSPTHSWKPAS